MIPRAAAMFARPAVRQEAMACSRNSTGVGALVRSDQYCGMVGVVSERDRTCRVVLPGAVESLDQGAAVGAADPFVTCPELEPGEFRRSLDRVNGGEQRGDVNAVARRLVVVVMLSTPSVSNFLGITDRRNATFPLPSLRVASFSNPYA